MMTRRQPTVKKDIRIGTERRAGPRNSIDLQKPDPPRVATLCHWSVTVPKQATHIGLVEDATPAPRRARRGCREDAATRPANRGLIGPDEAVGSETRCVSPQ